MAPHHPVEEATISPLTPALVAACIVLVTALLFVVISLRRLQSAHRRTLAKVRMLESVAASSTSAEHSEREHERDFFVRFAREFPHMTRELHSGVDAREIPVVLNKILLRTFEPGQSIVLFRRRNVATDESRGDRLTIASVGTPTEDLRAGVEVPIGEGEFGVAIKTEQVLNRDDFDQMASHVRTKLKQESLAGFDADLVAPMIFGGEPIGVLALSRPNLKSEGGKAVLRLIAHLGATSIQQSRAFRNMKSNAESDGLTGLYNKTFITRALGKHIVEAEERHENVSILLIDIDNFKHYNDTNGHDAGDHLLREFSQLLSDNLRSRDQLGRFGGEEFLIVFPNTDAAQALSAAEKIRRAVSEYDFAHGGSQPLGCLSFSGGVASYPTHCLGSAELVRAADRALYQAKGAGRNRVHEAAHQTFGEAGDSGVNPIEKEELQTESAVKHIP